MSRDEFERWLGNPFMSDKREHPALWGGSKEEVQDWERNPYAHPYVRGAYDMLLHMRKKP